MWNVRFSLVCLFDIIRSCVIIPPRLLPSLVEANSHHLTEGEFHVDLYTLPDTLIKMLWDFTQEKGVV